MNDATIRAALEAAAEAARVTLAQDDTCPQAGGFVCRTGPCVCARDAARAAVVAFLHALPDSYTEDGFLFWTSLGKPEESSMAAIALAVEKAARDE